MIDSIMSYKTNNFLQIKKPEVNSGLISEIPKSCQFRNKVGY